MVYIFLSPWNVRKVFAERYWDEKNSKSKGLPTEFPFSQIRPLMTNDDLFYWKKHRDKKYFEYSEDYIKELSQRSIVIPLELTIEEIITAAGHTDKYAGSK